MECRFVSFQKCLLTSVWKRLVKRSSACHTTQAEYLDLVLFAAQLRRHLIPIHLPLLTARIRLRHESFAMDQSDLHLLRSNILAHRGFGHFDFRLLRTQPIVDAVRSVPLFTRRRQIVFQNRVNERNRRLEFGFWSFALPPFFGNGIGQRASRTMRRWIPNFRDTPLIVPTPN